MIRYIRCRALGGQMQMPSWRMSCSAAFLPRYANACGYNLDRDEPPGTAPTGQESRRTGFGLLNHRNVGLFQENYRKRAYDGLQSQDVVR